MMSESVWQDWLLESESDCVTVTDRTIGLCGAYLWRHCDVLNFCNMNG